jgi:hypothetical protein
MLVTMIPIGESGIVVAMTFAALNTRTVPLVEQLWPAVAPDAARLSTGEERALALISMGLAELWSLRGTYDKLGAHRRLEAINRARALGLLTPVAHRA